MLDIEEKNINENVIYISMAGKLIYDTEEEAVLKFDDIIDRNKHILLDLSHLNYVNSSGLGIFINLLKNMKDKGKKLILIAPSREVNMLFEITSLDKMFEITKDIEEAKSLI